MEKSLDFFKCFNTRGKKSIINLTNSGHNKSKIGSITYYILTITYLLTILTLHFISAFPFCDFVLTLDWPYLEADETIPEVWIPGPHQPVEQSQRQKKKR